MKINHIPLTAKNKFLHKGLGGENIEREKDMRLGKKPVREGLLGKLSGSIFNEFLKTGEKEKVVFPIWKGIIRKRRNFCPGLHFLGSED